MKNKLKFFLLLVVAIVWCPNFVDAETINTTFPLTNSYTYYDSETNNGGFGGQPFYYNYHESVTGLQLNRRTLIPHLTYNTNYDASFTDLGSNSDVDTSLNDSSLDISQTDGFNGSFSVELGLSFGCAVGTNFCGLSEETHIPLNDNSYDTIPNIDFANYLLNHIYVVYENVNGRVIEKQLVLSTTNAYWDIGQQGFFLATTNFSSTNLTWTSTISDRSLYKFVGIRFKYDMSLIDFISTTIDRNTIQFSFNNNISLNYENSSYGTQPLIPDVDQTGDPNNLYHTDVNIQKQDNFLTILGDKIATNNVISDLLLLPVTLYQKILNTITSQTCPSMSLGTWFNTNINLPCFSPSQYLGQNVWTAIDVICSAYLVLSIRKRFVNIFNNMTNLRDRGNEVE